MLSIKLSFSSNSSKISQGRMGELFLEKEKVEE